MPHRRDPERAADRIERAAAPIARALAEALMRPRRQRGPVEGLAGTLAAHRAEAARLAAEPPLRTTPGAALARRARNLRLRRWQTVERAVADCIAGHVWPLFAPAPPRLDLAGEQARLVASLLTRTHFAVRPPEQEAAAVAHGCYPDQPLDAARFVAYAHVAFRLCLARRQPRPLRFLDVGCGGGLKLAAAAEFFDAAVGLEFDAGYAAAATRALAGMAAGRCEVIRTDALQFDGYGRFDVLYLYEPMRDAGKLRQLERAIVSAAADDAIFIAPYQGFAMQAESLGLRRFAPAVYLRDAGPQAAAELEEDTLHIGPQVIGPDLVAPDALGWLQPLWLACAANGIWPG
jgi:SAM-dependent methyltransferase